LLTALVAAPPPADPPATRRDVSGARTRSRGIHRAHTQRPILRHSALATVIGIRAGHRTGRAAPLRDSYPTQEGEPSADRGERARPSATSKGTTHRPSAPPR